MTTAMKATHTPGPWEVRQGNKSFVVMRAGTPRMVAETLGDTLLPEYAANARLIAAAPEMLALIAELADGIEVDIIGQDWLDKALALLAKIEGR